jgi:hypothetical protein
MLLRLDRITEEQRITFVPLADQMLYIIDTKKLYIGDGETCGGLDIASLLVDDKIPKNILTTTFLSDADRQEKILNVSELVYTTDTNKLYIGDGITTGGLVVVPVTNVNINNLGLTEVRSDNSPALGADLDLSGKNITGNGGIDINGNITADYININYSPFRGLADFNFAGENQGSYMQFNTSRGTFKSPISLQHGDLIAGLLFRSYTDSEFGQTAVIQAETDGPTINGNTPGKLKIGTKNHLGTDDTFCEFNSRGVFLAPVIQTGIYAAESIPEGKKGMIVFNDTTGKFQGHNGNAWVDLG